MGYQYHCVAGPTNIDVYSPKDLEKAVQTYENIINEQARQGWEYVGIDEFQTTLQAGCLRFWASPTVRTSKMLVFRKEA